MASRAYVFTDTPDNPMIIFIDQIIFVAKHDDGSRIRTSDGSDHVFHNVTFEEMKRKVLV